MAGAGLSRVPTHGTVFSRIQNLMRAGVIKERDRPLWYDVMVAFPPRDGDSHTGINHGPLVREILYPEDKIRAQFYKVYRTATPLNMARHSSINNTLCARFISKYQELENELPDDELFEATVEELTKEGFHLKKKGDKQRGDFIKQLSSTEVVSQTLASMFQKSMLAQDMDQDKTHTIVGNEENK